MRHAHIHVTGIVQGVGMRPFVYREAMAHGICGWVLNAGDGVHIEAHAPADALDAFVAALSEHAPAAARESILRIWGLAAGALPMNRVFALWRRRTRPCTRRSSRPISPPVTIACASCSIPPTDAITTPLSTALTAAHALPSSDRCLMTERPHRWTVSPCVPSAPRSMPTHSTGVFTRSPMPALIAGHILRGARL